MDSTSEVYNQIAKTYLEENKERGEVQSHIARFVNLMPQNGIVIDLGCGVGFDSRDIKAKRPDLQITGVDNSQGMLDQFKVVAKDISFIEQDMLTLELERNSIDGIWMNASLFHLPKDKGIVLLEKALNWLKSGGYLFIRTKVGEGEKVIPVTKYRRGDLSRFFAFYSQDELTQSLDKMGFKIEDTTMEVRKETWVNVLAKNPN